MKSNQIYEKSKSLLENGTSIYKSLKDIMEPEVHSLKEQGIIELIYEYYEYYMISIQQATFEESGEHLSQEQKNEYKTHLAAALYLACVDLDLGKSFTEQCRREAGEDVYKQYIESIASDDELYKSIVYTTCGSMQISFDADYYQDQVNYMNSRFLD